MAHRTQITLDDQQYSKLVALSKVSGLSMSELIRRAVDRTYVEGAAAALAESFGAWKGRSFDGASYVEALRRGLSRRLGERDGRPG